MIQSLRADHVEIDLVLRYKYVEIRILGLLALCTVLVLRTVYSVQSFVQCDRFKIFDNGAFRYFRPAELFLWRFKAVQIQLISSSYTQQQLCQVSVQLVQYSMC